MKTKLSNLLAQQQNVRFAYLFGSYADGSYDKQSDVDIAVYLGDSTLDHRLSLHHDLEKAVQKEIDLVVLNEIKNIYLLESILTDGVVLKDSDERDMFEVFKNHEIIDFKVFKRYIDAA